MPKYPQIADMFSALPSGRKERAKARRRLAEEADVTPATVSRWINGESAPHHDKVEAIGEVLGIPWNEVLATIAADLRPQLAERADRQAERRVLRALGESVDALLQGAEDEGREDLAELRAELRSALRAVQ